MIRTLVNRILLTLTQLRFAQVERIARNVFIIGLDTQEKMHVSNQSD